MIHRNHSFSPKLFSLLPLTLQRKRALLFISLLLLLCCANSTAMSQTGNRTEDFRRQPPAPLPAKPLNIPTPYETTLPNGLHVVVVEDSRLPLVSYRLAVRGGNINDPSDLPGLAGMLTGMLTEGTETRTSRQIADEVARLGATLTAGATSDYTTVSASSLSAYSDRILELLSDVALHPSFPEKELEIAKQNSKQGLIAQRGQAAFLANERLSRVIYGEHPYAVISPTPASIDAMTRDKLASFHRQTFAPGNSVLIVVGDVKRESLMRRVNELFGKWAGTAATQARFPAPPARTARAIYLVDRPGSPQSNIAIANIGLTRTSPDYFPMLVMHTVLGANASSRLFMNLREARGYTYGAYSNLDARRETGSFRATAEVRTPVTGASLKEFFYELERIRTEPVSDKELRDAKTYLTGIFPIRLETQEGLIDQLVQIKMFNLPADYLRTYRDRINAVTKEEVQRVARQYVTPDRVAIVVVGDAAAITDQIKSYAPTLELYDSSGNRKEMSSAKVATSTTGSGAVTKTVGPAGTGNSEDLLGLWTVEITLPNGQKLPAKIALRREGEKVSGTIESPMGTTSLNNLVTNGSSFESAIAFQMQGRAIEGRVIGSAKDKQLNGTITLNIPNAPSFNFTGTRAAQ